MSPQMEVAIVLRARKGRNLMLHTCGVGTKHVLAASVEVAHKVDRAARDQPAPGLDESGDVYSIGKVYVPSSGHMAVYRLVHQVLVIVVLPASGNTLAAANIVATVTRVLVTECKGVEVVPDKLLASDKRYASVYMALDAILSRGHLDGTRALLQGYTTLDSMTPSKLRQLRNAKDPNAPIVSATPTILPSKRKLSSLLSGASRMTFLPQSDLTSFNGPQLPYSHAPPPTAEEMGVTVQQPGDGVPIPLGDPNDPFAASELLQPGQLQEQQQQQQQQQPGDPFGPLPQDAELQPLDALSRAASMSGQQGPAPIVLPKHTGPGLQLCETWHGEVRGGRLVRAGLEGQVLWISADVRTFSANKLFALKPPEFPSSIVKSALSCCHRQLRACSLAEQPGQFVAETYSSVPASQPLLQYRLPPGFKKPPIMAQLGCVITPVVSAKSALLVAAHVAVTEEIGLHFDGLLVDLLLPASLGNPQRVQPPKAEWSTRQRCLRWKLDSPYPGMLETCVAAFLLDRPPQDAAELFSGTTLSVRMAGGKGETLSGVSIVQANDATSESKPVATKELNSWRAELTVYPEPAGRW